MRAAVYCRVSTDEQRDKQSIETQVDFARRFTDLNEIEIIDFYKDDGVSGGISCFDRPGAARMLADARAHKFDLLLIYKVDRLSRSLLDLLQTAQVLENTGVVLRSMTEPFDTASPIGKFVLQLLGMLAELEKANIRDRSMAGSRRHIREGGWKGGTPAYGYRVEGRQRSARLVVSEESIPNTSITEAGVIRLMYRMVGEDGKTCYAVAMHLEALGVPPQFTRLGRKRSANGQKVTPSGKWSVSRVRGMLTNPTYKGEFVYGRAATGRNQPEPVVGQVPAIVSCDLWDRTQAALRANQEQSKRNAKNTYLLRGLIKCGICGNNYSGKTYAQGQTRNPHWYFCIGRITRNGANNTRCQAKQIPGDIENEIWSDIEGFLRDPGDVLNQLSGYLNEWSRDAEQLKDELGKLELILASKKGERNVVVTLFRKGSLDESALDHQLAEIAGEETSINREIAEVRGRLAAAERDMSTIQTAEDVLSELRTRLDSGITEADKRWIVERLVAGIRVDTVWEDGKKEAKVHVDYFFAPSDGRKLVTVTHSPTLAHNSYHIGLIERVYSQERSGPYSGPWERSATR